ncbi:MAG: hypothetical protein MJ239_00055 [Bacilli bacterium]|nr:hypothetical protein [Bacilli bacterium]
MKKKAAFSLIGFASLLASCGESISFAYVPYQYGTLDETAFQKIQKEGYYRAGENTSVGDYKSFDEVYRDKAKVGELNFSWHVNLTSTGTRKMLVIPVQFEDYLAEEHLPKDSLDHIKEAFFGDDEHNQFYSVASYYDKSSYGRLHLEGRVTDWFTCKSHNYEELKNVKSSTSCTNRLREIRNEALAWYENNYPDDPLSNYEFEYGNENKTPAIYFVYAPPTVGKDVENYRSSMMWAFTINNPGPTSWSSYDLTNLNKGKVDAHTYIHEVGHILGLKDYYDSNGLMLEGNPYSGYFSPLGRADMMDYSLGDHNSYSKMLLNWARPYVPEGKCTITLRPFSSSGDFILLKNKWNGSVFDEYLLLEFYTPEYINYVDANFREEGTTLFNRSGIKAYHVDSRLFMTNKTGVLLAYTEGEDHSSYQVDVALDNSGKRNLQTSNTLIQLLDKSSGSGELTPFYVASTYQKTMKDSNGIVGAELRDALFYKGEGLSKDAVSFHDGGDSGFGFKVEDLTSTYAKITIE